MHKKLRISLLILAMAVLVLPLAFADAQIVPCGGHGQPACTINHLFDLLINIYNFLLGMSALVAMIFIVWGGVQMFSPTQDIVESGKKTLTYAISGLVIILLAYLAVNTIIIVLTGGGRTFNDLITLPSLTRSASTRDATSGNNTRGGDLPLDLTDRNALRTAAFDVLDTDNNGQISPDTGAMLVAQVIAAHGAQSGDSNFDSRFDLNDNGRIDDEDVNAFIEAFSSSQSEENNSLNKLPLFGIPTAQASEHTSRNQSAFDILDRNNDGILSLEEVQPFFDSLLSAVGLNEGDPGYDPEFDVNGDGSITSLDVLIFINTYSDYHNNLLIPGDLVPDPELETPEETLTETDSCVPVFASSDQSFGNAHQILPVDLNGNGRVDLVTRFYGTIEALINNGQGSFSSAFRDIPGTTIFGDIQAAHVDNDGNIDIVVAVGNIQSASANTLTTTTDLYWYKNNNPGFDRRRINIPGGSPRSSQVRLENGHLLAHFPPLSHIKNYWQGHNNILVDAVKVPPATLGIGGNEHVEVGFGHVSVLSDKPWIQSRISSDRRRALTGPVGSHIFLTGPVNRPNAGLTQRLLTTSGQVITDNAVGVEQIVITDINGDGHDDILAYIDRGSGLIKWWSGRTLEENTIGDVMGGRSRNPGGKKVWLAAADLNGNGKTDIAVAVRNESPNPDNSDDVMGTVTYWLEQLSDNEWTPHVIEQGGKPHGINIADINGNGQNDIILAGWPIKTYLQSTTGNDCPSTPIPPSQPTTPQEPVSPPATSNPVKKNIAAGQHHTCAIVNGGVRCWGSNSHGQLGNKDIPTGQNAGSTVGVGAEGLTSNVTHIASGDSHNCAIHGPHSIVRCWGKDIRSSTSKINSTPTTMPISKAIDIALGKDHACVVREGAAQCWGSNSRGQTGSRRSNTSRSTLVSVEGMGYQSGVTAIAAGDTHTCAIQNSSVKCWGGNNKGQLGTQASALGRATPIQIPGLESGVTAIAAGANHTCAIQNGGVKCWGYNTVGQLGNGENLENTNRESHPTPVQVTGLTSGVTAIAAGANHNDFADHTCAIHNDRLKCWGWNAYGQLGTGSTSPATSPVTVRALENGRTTDISLGGQHTCATFNGSLRCWGWNFRGQLGNNSTDNANQPQPVILQRSW